MVFLSKSLKLSCHLLMLLDDVLKVPHDLDICAQSTTQLSIAELNLLGHIHVIYHQLHLRCPPLNGNMTGFRHRSWSHVEHLDRGVAALI